MANETIPITALALNCTLTPSPDPSSTQLMTDQVLAALAEHGVTGSSRRLVDLDIKPGVQADQGEGDDWPGIREEILAADILLVSTPTWMGHMSSIAQRVLERLDAELSAGPERASRPASAEHENQPWGIARPIYGCVMPQLVLVPHRQGRVTAIPADR